ncbi:MAG: aminopeptidase P family protein [Clostridia bacterium]|nr:aminopeptidase P family protein [Clostridia bacterium]
MTSLAQIQASLEKGECALFFSPINRRFLTGFRSSDGVLVVTREKAALYLDSRYYEMGCIAREEGRISRELSVLPAPFSKDFGPLSESGGAPVVRFEDRFLTVARLESLKKAYPKSEFLPLGGRVEELRIVKTEEEIRRIAQAQAIAEETYRYILERLEVGRTEKEIAAEMEYHMKLHGADGSSFGIICVSGTRSSLPHGSPTEKRIGKDEFVTLDFGCTVDGYCSDMTRTVCVGRASDEMRLVYDTALKAQEAAIATVRAGVLGSTVDAAARDLIRDAGFGEYFGHTTGHGIGMEVHELPSFAARYDKPVPARSVLSVEPGIYLPAKFGVRIEDLVVVRENGCDNLNATPKDLLQL